MNIIKRAFICLIAAFLMLNTVACNMLSSQNISEKIEDLGYEVEANGSEYALTDGDTQFVIKVTLGTARLQSITRELSPHGGEEVVDNTGILTIKPKNSKYIELTVDYTVLETFKNGNSMNIDERVGIVCGTDFNEESIDPYDPITVLGKASKYFYIITNYWMSSEEFKALYAEGMDIVNSINE